MMIMKPIFVHKYKPEIAKKKDEFLDFFWSQGKELEKIFIADTNDVADRISVLRNRG